MNLGRYCRERLEFVAGKLIERDAAQQALSGCAKQQPGETLKEISPLEKKRVLAALLEALAPPS